MYKAQLNYFITILFVLSAIAATPNLVLSEGDGPQALRLASDVWPPFTDHKGKPRRATELIETALNRGSVESRTVITSWDKVIEGLKSDKFDGCAAIWRTGEREDFLRYSKPYLENRLILVARAGTAVEKVKISSLKGKRLAVVKGYAYGDILDKAKGIIIVSGDNDKANLEALLAKEVDYMLADELLVHNLFDNYPKKSVELLAAATTPIARRSLHFVVRKNLPNSGAIISDFDKNVKRLVADGTYNRLLGVAWIRTDVDGDGVSDFVSTSHSGLKNPKKGTGYQLFLKDPLNDGQEGKAKYVVDGKQFNSWDQASSTMTIAAAKRPKTPKTDDVGLVLLQF